MGKVTRLRGPSKLESCVVGDHVYLVFSHAELVDIVHALHSTGVSALEQRLAKVLLSMPSSTNGRSGPSTRAGAVFR
jgi:hypothetical protein